MSFDANMRHLKKGVKFFAKIHSVICCKELQRLGVASGDLIRAEMMCDDSDDPTVKFEVKEGCVEIKDSDYMWNNLFTYEGCQDLTGFVDDDSLRKATEIIDQQ